jgi:NADH dehydrogenase (ubiquinone) 1 alpha subcomplex subunit 5
MSCTDIHRDKSGPPFASRFHRRLISEKQLEQRLCASLGAPHPGQWTMSGGVSGETATRKQDSERTVLVLEALVRAAHGLTRVRDLLLRDRAQERREEIRQDVQQRRQLPRARECERRRKQRAREQRTREQAREAEAQAARRTEREGGRHGGGGKGERVGVGAERHTDLYPLPLTSPPAMFRLTRPLFQAVRKTTTGLTGLSVHNDPLPALTATYERTLSALGALPPASVYRQGVEALTQRKLGLVKSAAGDIAQAEAALDEGQIEEALVIAEDELKLVGKMAEWKAYVFPCFLWLLEPNIRAVNRWEPLEEQPQPGQWEYFGSKEFGINPIQTQ